MSAPREASVPPFDPDARPVVLLTDPIDQEAVARLSAAASVVRLGDPGFEELPEAICKSDIVVVRRRIPADCLARAGRLRALIRHGVGLDFIPVEVASDLGIAVANTPGTNATSVAEAAIGMMLAGFRRIALKDRLIREGEWSSLREAAFAEHELSGKKLGLIGFGAIGQEIARIAHFGFGMEILAVLRARRPVPPHVQIATLPDALRESAVVVLACPLTDETRGMIGAHELACMQPGAAIVNVARGAVIQEPALIEALRSKHLSFAALDVFDRQPPARENPLLAMDNVVLAPHTAGITAEAVRRMSQVTVDEALRIISGDRPLNLVNDSAWDQIARRWGQLARFSHRI